MKRYITTIVVTTDYDPELVSHRVGSRRERKHDRDLHGRGRRRF
jgi:hypothetical protein